MPRAGKTTVLARIPNSAAAERNVVTRVLRVITAFTVQLMSVACKWGPFFCFSFFFDFHVFCFKYGGIIHLMYSYVTLLDADQKGFLPKKKLAVTYLPAARSSARAGVGWVRPF